MPRVPPSSSPLATSGCSSLARWAFWLAPSMPRRDVERVDPRGEGAGRPWGIPVAVRGEIQWPSMGSFAWPPSDEDYLNRYIIPVFGEMPLGDISVSQIRTWVTNLNGSGLAPATVVKAGQILSKVLRSAVEEGVMATNPCSAVRLPRVERTEMRYLAPAEVSRLADAIDPRYRAVVLLGAYGGLRAGELFGLRVPRLDLPAQRLDVVEQVVEVSGNLHFGAPKTKAGRRSVPLPAVVCDALTEHLRQWPRDDLVFTAPDGGPVRLASWRSRFFKRAVDAAGVAPLRVHDLRHTAVSLWIAAGASPREIASRAGHTSVSIVLDRYGHLLPGSESRVNDELDRLAAPSATTPKSTTVKTDRADEPQLNEAERPVSLRIVRARSAHAWDRHNSVETENRPSPGTFEWAQRDSNPRPQPCETGHAWRIARRQTAADGLSRKDVDRRRRPTTRNGDS